MDTKPLENEAELYIQSVLIKHGFSLAKPNFDTDGADLLVVDNIKNKFTPVLRIQCKGRNISTNGSNISIPREYVGNNFVVFLYTKLENYESELFIFLPNDIAGWRITNNEYVLSFNKNTIKKEGFIEKQFHSRHCVQLREILRTCKIKKYTSVIIDSIFLNKAIEKTINIYKEIYPDKGFSKPRLLDVVSNIIKCYDNFKSDDKSINIVYMHNPDVLQQTQTYDNNPSKFTNSDNTSCKLSVEETDGFVNFEILEYLNRIINSENIILVADDLMYEKTLNQYKDKGVDITLVMFKSTDGRQMYTEHMWGDIAYPVGLSIGLKEHEL